MAQAIPLRILYAGTPEFAVPPLQRLLERGYLPLMVLTQPDRPAGRGRQLQASPVKQAALAAGLSVRQPQSLKEEGIDKTLEGLEPDLLVVVAYGLILPARILRIPRYGCWNVHASLLPRWRGAAPIQRAIEAGDEQTGVCIMQMDEGLDTGDVLLRSVTAISPEDTAGSLHDRLSVLGAGALLRALDGLASGKPPVPEPQPADGVTYARKLDKAEARIDWTQDAASIERRVRAFNPWPVAWCDIGGERTRIWSARVGAGTGHEAPGSVRRADASGIHVATGRGELVLTELQRPGGRRVKAAQYLTARHPPPCLAGPG